MRGRICFAIALQWVSFKGGSSAEADSLMTWHKVSAASAPSERTGATAALDSQQRMWIFAGYRYSGGYFYLNDLHYFDVEAKTWHKIQASRAPAARKFASAVFDSKQRMWIFGGLSNVVYDGSDYRNDLHYFDMEARIWHQVEVSNAPAKRASHKAVLDSKQRMWIFGGFGSWRGGVTNDLHYFDVEARTWHKVDARNAPSPRSSHVAVIDAQQRMWVFAGYSNSQVLLNDLHYFDVEAMTWHKVDATNVPAGRSSHAAIIDAQQRMWIFGGRPIRDELWYFDVEAKTWRKVEATNVPAGRFAHVAVLDAQQRMWVFGGQSEGVDSLNDLHYLQVAPASSISTSLVTSPTTTTSVLTGPPATTKPTTTTTSTTSKVDCSTSVCPDGHVRKNQSLTGSASGCCEVSCQLFTCPRFHILKESAGKIAGRTYDVCCDRSCEIFSCPWGYMRKTAAEELKGASYQECCDETCRMFQCPAGYMAKAEHNFQILGSLDNCCAAQPAGDVEGGSLEQIADPSAAGFVLLENFTNFTPGVGKEDPPPDNSSNLLVPILVPLLLACVAAGFSIFCFWAKKHRGCQAQAELGPVLPLSSDPRAMLPLPVSSSIRPLIFAWESRMTAEWPRGKVLKLEVGEHDFEAGGQRYQFADRLKSFSWADGTVQEVENIQGNVVHWVTQHPRTEWRRFRWICTPQCAAEGLHDMEVSSEATSSDAYRCKSCSSSRAAESHWCCPVHEEHLCPTCAELPPKAPTLGVAANFLTGAFPPMARGATSSENPNFYTMCPLIAHGDQGLGFGKSCPRDGQLNCSIVDALEDAQSGKVTHFVSWCWAYRLNDVVTALNRWLRTSGGDPTDVFLWMCFFCNNQYRILQEETKTGSEDLKGIFEKHLGAAGRMLVLLDDIRNPTYVSRAWCIFESYVCIQQNFPMEILLPSSAQSFFREAVCSGAGGGMEELTRAISSLDVRDAKASQRADEDLIKRLILTDIGFDAVNQAVRDRLVDELLSLFREILVPRPR